MNLAVVGAGYVGLVTASVFSDLGNKVKVVEIDKEKIKLLEQGKVPFFEPGLDKLLLKNLRKNRLFFTGSYKEALSGAEVIFVCVGTPTKNNKPDLNCIYDATKSIAENLKNSATVVIKSTVPPGTNKKLRVWMKKFTKVNFDLASVPEFLREGKVISDSFSPYRIIIGAESKAVAQKLLTLHKKLPGKRLICDPASAQMIKYASNAFLPTKISFANSISVLCEKYQADIEKVMKGMGMDKRIGPDFLSAGLGYGGSCFPKDVAALIDLSKKANYSFPILKAVEKTNQKQTDLFVKKLLKLCHGSIKGKNLVILGLAFKPGTSDMREARSIYVIEKLLKLGGVVRVCDPVALLEAKKILKNKVEYFRDPYLALKEAEALLLVTEWEEYKKLDFVKIKKTMRKLVVLDGRNIYNRKKLERLGFIYEGIGK